MVYHLPKRVVGYLLLVSAFNVNAQMASAQTTDSQEKPAATPAGDASSQK